MFKIHIHIQNKYSKYIFKIFLKYKTDEKNYL